MYTWNRFEGDIDSVHRLTVKDQIFPPDPVQINEKPRFVGIRVETIAVRADATGRTAVVRRENLHLFDRTRAIYNEKSPMRRCVIQPTADLHSGGRSRILTCANKPGNLHRFVVLNRNVNCKRITAGRRVVE